MSTNAKVAAMILKYFRICRTNQSGSVLNAAAKLNVFWGKGTGIIFKGSGFYATDYKNNRPSCGREKTCCGREVPCDKKPCNE